MARTKKRRTEPLYRLSYRPRSVYLLRSPSGRQNRIENLKDNHPTGDISQKHQGIISVNTKRKIQDAIIWLEASADWKWCFSKGSGKWFRWRLNFIHLTLPSQGNKTDQFIKKLLHEFFTYAFRKCGLRSYVWKAEPQKRGEIHFHITSDCFIWKTTLQNIWNGILRRYGMIGANENPPSTRVHPTHNVRNMAAYLIKYMTKNDQNRRTITGRLWGCSRNLSNVKSIFFDFGMKEAFAEYQMIKVADNMEKQYDYVSCKFLTPVFWEALPDCELRNNYRKKIKAIRTGYEPPEHFFYNQEGKPLTFEDACTMKLPPIDRFMYEQQLTIKC